MGDNSALELKLKMNWYSGHMKAGEAKCGGTIWEIASWLEHLRPISQS